MPLSVASSHPTALLGVDVKYPEEWYESQVRENTRNFSITDMQNAEAYAYQLHNEKHESDRGTQLDTNHFFYWAEMHKQLELMETNCETTDGNGAPSNMNGTGKDKTDLATEKSVGEQSHQG